MAYIGASPSNGVRRKHTYTATASQTTFSGAGAEGVSLNYRDSNYVDVYVNGVKLGDADYTATSGTSIVLGVGAAVNDIVEIMAYDVFSVADTVSKADGGTFDGNVAMAGTLGVTGETTLSANLNLGDNDKAIFGAGDDLQIYHDGSNSIIKDNGTSNIRIQTTGSVQIGDEDYNEIFATFNDDSSVNLFFNGSLKFNTTSTGIDVTGTAVTDGLTVAGNVSVDGGTIKLNGNFPTGSSNTALGNGALNGTLTGQQNTAIGSAALSALTSGNDNTAVGRVALSNNTTGGQNTATGRYALSANTTGSSNTALGVQALVSNTTAGYNTAIGYQAGYSNTTGASNTVLGAESLFANTTGNNNVSVGLNTMRQNSTGSSNTALGRSALQANTTASNNTAVGYLALSSDTQGGLSTAIGKSALANQNFTSATNSWNTAVGAGAGEQVTTGTNNTLIGGIAGDAITTGANNTAVGYLALSSNTTASSNTAVGQGAVFSNTTGASITGVGREVLYNNTTGENNSALGFQALSSNTTGSYNIAVGTRALNSNTTAGYNTAVGYRAGYSTTGDQNTFVGKFAGNLVTTGSLNTIIGAYNGNQAGLDIRTASNYIVMSDGGGTPRLYINSSGHCKIPDAYTSTTGNSANLFVDTDGRLIRATSSQRYKNTINDSTHGLTELLTLRPVTYKGNNDGDNVFGGLIAEEVHDAGLTEFVQYNDDGEPDALAYGNMVSLCIKAIQELKTELDSAKARIATLEGE